jgi:hypothetical protein
MPDRFNREWPAAIQTTRPIEQVVPNNRIQISHKNATPRQWPPARARIDLQCGTPLIITDQAVSM